MRGGQTSILVTVHIRCGKPPERLPELRAIARWIRQWAEQEREWGYDLARRHQRRPRARPELSGVHLHGLQPPLKLRGLPRTIFPAGSKAFYDQIAWFGAGTDVPVLSLQYTGKAGNFDFVPLVMAGLDREELSWRMSDHYPLWVEFSTRTD